MPPNKGNGKGIRFLRDHLNFGGPDCLIWPFHRLPSGYGILGYNGEVYRASRLMCELVNGPAPSGVHEAAHSCGNGDGGGVHPSPLFWKTPTENQADRKLHGTVYRRGRKPKLTRAQVREIRSLVPAKTHQELADRFGVSRENIGQIIRGQIWRSAG